jgi:hypothetical protein
VEMKVRVMNLLWSFALVGMDALSLKIHCCGKPRKSMEIVYNRLGIFNFQHLRIHKVNNKVAPFLGLQFHLFSAILYSGSAVNLPPLT